MIVEIKQMNTKIIISQSIMWSAVIFVLVIVEDKEFALLMLIVLAIVSLLNLSQIK
jgi:hypothetical protein